MKSVRQWASFITTTIVLAFGASGALAQHEQGSQPNHDEKRSQEAKATDRVGDPYPLETCPISGKKLGTMGNPVVKTYGGREVRFCCPECPAQFEKNLVANLAKLDEQIIKDQG